MRILLDEHLPRRLTEALTGHDVSTVRAEGWAGTENGALLARAADAGFEVLLTNDASIEHQQNFAEVQIVVVILDAPTNKLEDLLPLVPKTLEVVSRATAGEAHHLGKL